MGGVNLFPGLGASPFHLEHLEHAPIGGGHNPMPHGHCAGGCGACVQLLTIAASLFPWHPLGCQSKGNRGCPSNGSRFHWPNRSAAQGHPPSDSKSCAWPLICRAGRRGTALPRRACASSPKGPEGVEPILPLFCWSHPRAVVHTQQHHPHATRCPIRSTVQQVWVPHSIALPRQSPNTQCRGGGLHLVRSLG